MKFKSLPLAAALLSFGLTNLAKASDSEGEEHPTQREVSQEDFQITVAPDFDSSLIEQRANLNCQTSVSGKIGSATCTGSGTWRVRVDCPNQPDPTSGWISQSTGVQVTQSAKCTIRNARGATVESR